MKTTRTLILSVLLSLTAIGASAQQVNTLYFLENAPMRHTINPAFQPVSSGFINFTPLGWMYIGAGNNSLTMSDVLYVDPTTGKTITPLHPNGNKTAFLNVLRNMTSINGDINISLLNMGFRIKENGYLTIGVNEKIETGTTLPKSMYQFLLGGGMTNLTGTNQFSLTGIGVGTSIYTEIGVGYSHRINEQWTLGGKLKVLLGQANLSLNAKQLAIDASVDQWHLTGNLGLNVAGPLNWDAMPQMANRTLRQVITDFTTGSESGSTFDPSKLFDFSNIPALIMPSGYGAALDFGLTYKPIENLQISLAINDLGFIYWNRAQHYGCTVDTVFTGAGEFNLGDPAFKDADGNFSTQLLMDSVVNGLRGLSNAVMLQGAQGGYAKMASAKLNIGIDLNFWENRVGLGLLSATRLYNARLYEEITFGLAFRPVNWFNIAATYSLMNNGKFSNIGAGLSFMPYDGINLTLAMDYIPTSYAAMDINGTPKYVLPYKTKMVNLALGFSICWGTNRRDRDKDGVWDKLDQCPDTPRGVKVDASGCPLDDDKDGVANYKDQCPDTPEGVAVDENGCPQINYIAPLTNIYY